MTFEEITDKYAEKVVKHKMAVHDIFNEKVTKKEIKDAVIYGLKAGRPVWHKVADGDLPKIGKTCLVYLANGDVIIARLREDNVWTTNGHNAFENVIAWKEFEQEQRIKELQQENEKLKRGYHYEVEVINGKPTGKAILVPDGLAYAKSIIQDLLNNSDEYAKQRAREFLEENLK